MILKQLYFEHLKQHFLKINCQRIQRYMAMIKQLRCFQALKIKTRQCVLLRFLLKTCESQHLLCLVTAWEDKTQIEKE